MSQAWAGLIAAAGRSARMGRPKATLPLEGSTFVATLARAFLAAGLSPVVITLPEGDARDDVRAALDGVPVTCVPNRAPTEGLTGSVQTALRLAPGAAGLVLCPVDAPFVDGALVRALIEALRGAGNAADAAVPLVEGQRGHPAAFRRAAFPALAGCGGSGGPRALLASLGKRVVEVPWRDARVLADVNTPALYEAIVKA